MRICARRQLSPQIRAYFGYIGKNGTGNQNPVTI